MCESRRRSGMGESYRSLTQAKSSGVDCKEALAGCSVIHKTPADLTFLSSLSDVELMRRRAEERHYVDSVADIPALKHAHSSRTGESLGKDMGSSLGLALNFTLGLFLTFLVGFYGSFYAGVTALTPVRKP